MGEMGERGERQGEIAERHATWGVLAASDTRPAHTSRAR